MLKCQSMKNWVGSKPPVNVILFLLYMESYCCFKIDRGLKDISDSLDVDNNCNSIERSFVQHGRCKCDSIASIASINTGPLKCIADKEIDESKYT